MKRKSRPAPRYLTEEETDRLFRAITDVRDLAMFRLAYHRGLRASELGKLAVSDYRPSEERLLVHRLKGSRSGEYPLVPEEQAALRA